MPNVWIDQNDWDTVRSLVKNIKVYNGDIQYWGNGKNAGINIVCNGGSEIAETYSGYFAISDSSDDEAVKVAVAYGRCRVNSTDFEVQETEVEITGNGYVYLETAMNDTGEFVPPAVKFSEDYPVNEDGKFKALLGVVNIANEKITEIKQAQYGFNYGIICGECL